MVPLCQIRPCSEDGSLSSNHHSADCTWQWCSVCAYVRTYVHVRMLTVVQNRWGWLSRPDVHNWYLVNSLQWNLHSQDIFGTTFDCPEYRGVLISEVRHKNGMETLFLRMVRACILPMWKYSASLFVPSFGFFSAICTTSYFWSDSSLPF